jgi:hypothetical protein
MPRTSEVDFENELRDFIEQATDMRDDMYSVRSFEEAMILTLNRGLVVTLPNGAEFQVTIVQSKLGKDVEEDEFDE